MSRGEFNGRALSGTAGEALTKNRFGNMTGSTAMSKIIAKAGSGAKVTGIAPEDYASGVGASLVYDGEGWLEVNGSSVNIATGDFLKPDADGIGVKAATDKDFYGAQALEPATTDNALIRARIIQGYFAV